MKYIGLIIVLFTFTSGFAQQQELDRQLFDACYYGHYDQVRIVVANGANVNARYYDSIAYMKNDWTPLHCACIAGDSHEYLKIIKYLIKKGADVNSVIVENEEFKNVLPINFAAQDNYTGWKEAESTSRQKYSALIVTMLIKNKADINALDNKGNTVFHYMAKNKYGTEIVELLIEKGADINAKNKNGETPLHFAAKNESGFEIVKLLIDNGAIFVADSNGVTPFLLATANENGLDIMQYLIYNGININEKDISGRGPLRYAFRSRTRDIEKFKLLINNDVDINNKDINGYTPLLIALYSSNYDISKLLIDNGADVNAIVESDYDYTGYTVLHFALQSVYTLDLVKILIEKGADVNLLASDGLTPILIASQRKDSYDVIKLLIEKGADVKVKCSDDYNPLHYAAYNSENAETLRLLIESGIDINAKTSWNETALHLAVRSINSLPKVNVLIENGADLSIKNNKGETAGYLVKTFCTKPVIEWVSIPGGTLTKYNSVQDEDIKTNKTIDQVLINPFVISKFEVTFEQYDAFCEATGREKPDDEGWGRGNRPVINVSWFDANDFALWIGCRLPTKEEWEYACRAGTKTYFNTGDCLDSNQANFDGTINFKDCETSEPNGKTMPVGSFPPNEYGLYDMHGNVWEWIYSCSAIETTPRRGGSFNSRMEYCSSSFRGISVNSNKFNDIGFRIVKDSVHEKEFGSLLDERDGNTYKTVKIGNQVWMAENLKFKPKSGSWEYEDSAWTNILGRFYNWKTAQHVCPNGWILPSKDDYKQLVENFCCYPNTDYDALKFNGTTGFDAKMVIRRISNETEFGSAAEYADFWTSTAGKKGTGYKFKLTGVSKDSELVSFDKNYGYNVRCIKKSE